MISNGLGKVRKNSELHTQFNRKKSAHDKVYLIHHPRNRVKVLNYVYFCELIASKESFQENYLDSLQLMSSVKRLKKTYHNTS